MPDIPVYVRAAMQRLVAVRDLAANDDPGWLTSVYGDASQWKHEDDLRSVAYFFIDAQREIDT